MGDKLQAGELICDGQTVSAGMKFLGSTQTHSKSLDKLTLKAGEGKEGYELGLWVGATQKGLSKEVLLANLSTIVAHRADLSIEVETTNLAEMIGAAGIPLTILDKEAEKSGKEAEKSGKEAAKEAAKSERREVKASRVQMATLVKYVGGSGPWKPDTTLNIFTEQGSDLVFDAVLTRTLRIPLTGVSASSDSSMETIRSSRVTATRLATVGIFALAAKKKKTETITHQYLHIEGDSGIHLVFETKKSFDVAEKINGAATAARTAAGISPSDNGSMEPRTPQADGGGAHGSEGPASASIPDQIRDLAQLRDQGVLTDDEFATKKAELLARM